MTTEKFKSIFEQGKANYSNDTNITRCLNDLRDAFDGELAVSKYHKDWRGETAIIELEDGRVQLNTSISACKGAYYFHIEVSHTYDK